MADHVRRAPTRTASTASPSTWASWWFNLRPSNTEPLLRLNLEAPTAQACDAHVAELRRLIAEADVGSDTDPEGMP